MLDYDGTLAPFVRERMQARTWPGVPERLMLLATRARTRLVLISGRPAGDFRSLLPPDLRVEIWGSHGREHVARNGDSSITPLEPAQDACLSQLESALRAAGLDHIIEKKVGSLAMHTRGLPTAVAERVNALAHNFQCSLPGEANRSGDAAQRDDSAHLEWLAFDGGIELRGTGCTKATAVHSILAAEPPDAPVAYLGDDQTDEDAFAALADRPSSLRVLVRPEPRPSAADLYIVPPDELLDFLDRWIDATADDATNPHIDPAIALAENPQ